LGKLRDLRERGKAGAADVKREPGNGRVKHFDLSSRTANGGEGSAINE